MTESTLGNEALITKIFPGKITFCCEFLTFVLFNFLDSANQLRKPMFLNEVNVSTKCQTPFFHREWRNGFTVVFNFTDFLQVPSDTDLLKDFRRSTFSTTISIIFSREALSLWSHRTL
jgi:hypothetical protein